MAILSRIKINPQQRFDLEDLNALQAALRTDSKLRIKKFISTTNQIQQGFVVTGIGLPQATVLMANSTLLLPENNFDFSWFTSEPGAPDQIITDAELTDDATNFVEIQLCNQDGTPLTKAFWDPEANGGAGLEFNQIVNTITDLKVQFTTSTGGFSGSPDTIPLCIIDTDSGGNITRIIDERPLFGRLAIPSDLDLEYSWGTKQEPTFTLVLSGVSGTFEAGEQITVGSETATVVVGGTTSITFNAPSGRTFQAGDTATGGTSGATGTVVSIYESFVGVDKSLATQDDINKAIMTELKRIKGTRFWWEDANSSQEGNRRIMDSILVQEAVDASWSWSGTELSITDASGTPLDADDLARLKLIGDTGDVLLSRQDGQGGSTTIPIGDGEVAFIKLPDANASRTYSGVGTLDAEYQVVSSDDYENSDKNYWLAYRQGSMLYVRGYGEMETGESTPITDPDKETILSLINSNLAASNQDRQLKLIEGGTWSVVDNAGTLELTWSEDAYIQVPGQADTRNTLSAQTISLPNAASVAYVDIERTSGVPVIQAVTVADIDAVADDADRVIIARRVDDGVLVGSSSFLLKDGEFLELDGALAEINRYFGQLRIKELASNPQRVQVTGVDVSKLDSTLLGQTLSNLLLEFGGAQIDFTTGDVFESDGVTPLGLNFTPATVPASEWVWYSVTLLPSTLTANNKITGNLLVLPASGTGATKDLAPRAPFSSNGIPLGQVAVQRDALDTAFEDITSADVVQIGIGSGSGGGGTGDANSFIETLKNRLNDSIYEAVTPYVAAQDEEDANLIDVSSTGEFSIVDARFSLPTIGDTLVSANLLDQTFLNGDGGLNSVELLLKWDDDAVDTGATYEVSRNGGLEYQTITMERVDESALYRGIHTFAEEAMDQTLAQYATVGTDVVLTDTVERAAQPFDVANLSVVRNLEFTLNKTGTPTGNYLIQIVSDDSGDPSSDPDELYFESDLKSVASLSAGVQTITQAVNLVLKPGTYWLVIKTDTQYQSSYDAGVDEIAVQGGASTPVAETFDGATWTPTAVRLQHSIEGIELDLRLRVTSSIADVLLEGFGLYYDEAQGQLAYATTVDGITRVSFQAVADNLNSFVLPFKPNPDTLMVHLLGSGQSFRFGDFSLQGNTVVFPVDQFNNDGVERGQTLVFDQIRGGAFDNSDANRQLLATNHLGDPDNGANDLSVAGRGIFLRRPDGTLRELIINDNDEIEIYSV